MYFLVQMRQEAKIWFPVILLIGLIGEILQKRHVAIYVSVVSDETTFKDPNMVSCYHGRQNASRWGRNERKGQFIIKREKQKNCNILFDK